MQIPRSPVRFRLRPGSRLAQLVERKTLNLVVVGSSPTVGAPTEPMAQWQRVGFQTRRLGVRIPLGSWSFLFLNIGLVFGQAAPHLAMFSLLWRSWQRVGLIILRSRVRSSPGALNFNFFCNTFLHWVTYGMSTCWPGFRLDGRAVQGASLRH